MHARRVILVFVVSLVLNACAVESEVRPLKDGEFSVTEHRAPMFSGTVNAVDYAKKTAIRYCQSQGKELHSLKGDSTLDTTEGPMIYTATFTCAESDN